MLRKASRFYPEKRVAMKAAETSLGVFKCRSCKREYGRADIAVDHVHPVIDPAVGFVDWNTYIARLFCSAENMQVLCTTCHQAKTNAERKLRTRGTK